MRIEKTFLILLHRNTILGACIRTNGAASANVLDITYHEEHLFSL